MRRSCCKNALVLAALLPGCAAPPPAPGPLAKPPVVVETHYFSGSTLSGPLEQVPAAAELEDAWHVRVTLIALDRLPDKAVAFKPLGSAARLIAASRGGVPILDAVKASPFRIVNGVVSLATGGDEKKEGTEEIPIEFAPGDASAVSAEAAKLAPLLERLRQGEKLAVTLTHEIGGGDLARAGMRANPSPADCLSLASRLRTKKMQLLEQRAGAAAVARAAYAAGLANDAAEDSSKLRALDRELGLTELALDQMYDLLRAGADRQAARRTREASLAIARARLAAVKWALVVSGAPGIDDAVRVVRPSFNDATGESGGKVTVRVALKKD